MIFYHGFSLKNEEVLFGDFVDNSAFTVAGFSYGAQLALEHACGSIERVENLILLSPAFFQSENSRFTRLQLLSYHKNRNAYIQNFLANVSYPAKVDISSFLEEGSAKELEALLSYRWDREKISSLLKRGTKIEVYLGGRDKIVNTREAFRFFSSLTTSYFIKDAGHLLQ